jgi:excisionase family DNA binding protein
MMEQQKLVIQLVTTEADLIKALDSLIEQRMQNYQALPTSNAEQADDELLTIAQVAKFFQVSETTIHAWKNTGVLPFVKMKSRIRFKKSEILAYDSRLRKKVNR